MDKTILHMEQINLNEVVLPEKLIKEFSPYLLRKYKFIPINKKGDMITCVFSEEPSFEVIEGIQLVTGFKIDVALGTKVSIQETLEKLFPFNESENNLNFGKEAVAKNPPGGAKSMDKTSQIRPWINGMKVTFLCFLGCIIGGVILGKWWLFLIAFFFLVLNWRFFKTGVRVVGRKKILGQELSGWEKEIDDAIGEERWNRLLPNKRPIPEFNFYFHYGIIYGKQGKYDLAIANFNKAIQIEPTFSLSYYYRGLAYIYKDDFDKAIVDFTKVLEIEPNYANAYVHRGSAYLLKGDKNMAITDFNKAAEIDPNNEFLNKLLGHLTEFRAYRPHKDN